EAHRPSPPRAAPRPVHGQRRDDRRGRVLRAAPSRHGDSGRRAQRSQARVTKEELSAVLAEAQTRAKTDGSGNDVPEPVLRILTAASGTENERETLKGVEAGRALPRVY